MKCENGAAECQVGIVRDELYSLWRIPLAGDDHGTGIRRAQA